MSFGITFLELLSRNVETEDLNAKVNNWNSENSLDLLEKFIPEFHNTIANNSFVDFGCGVGEQSIALAKNGASKVLGIDTNKQAISEARQRAEDQQLGESCTFVEKAREQDAEAYDYVISQNSMEHFPDPLSILLQMKSLLNKNGKILLTFGPPWLAPYGSHMHFFTKFPWVNVFFSEQTVMSVRSKYRDDGAKSYHEVAFGLNKMTVTKFEMLVAKAGLRFEYKDYTAVKRISFLSKIPFVREFFINQVSCILVS